MTIREETYCLLGLARADSTYVILAVVKPPQRTEIKNLGHVIITSVYSAPCPPSTIADLHTHPFRSSTPSIIDSAGWIKNRRYTLHLIAFAAQDDLSKVGFSAYDYSDSNKPRHLAEGWLTIKQEGNRWNSR